MRENITIGEVTKLVEKTSSTFEFADRDLKLKYIMWNISAFNIVSEGVSTRVATFGTGYPFYCLGNKLQGSLPVISEQIRYNRQLVKDSRRYQKSIYECRSCLGRNAGDMKDLKTICKPCPNMPDSAKPRKLINRLPDLDMWLICKDGTVEESGRQLKRLLEEYDMIPSDVDPIRTMEKVAIISKRLNQGKMPERGLFLPIDTHIIEESKIKQLIGVVPKELATAKIEGKVPYWPITPKSLRKEWQYDDTSYNFIYDFLSAFTAFNFSTELGDKLRDVRCQIANEYTGEELYQFLLSSATDSNFRRFKSTPALKKIFLSKMDEWRVLNRPDEREESKGTSEGPNMDDDL